MPIETATELPPVPPPEAVVETVTASVAVPDTPPEAVSEAVSETVAEPVRVASVSGPTRRELKPAAPCGHRGMP